MKKLLLLSVLLVGCILPSIAQNNYRDPSDDPEGDFSFFATLGTRPMQLSSTDIYFAYVDESPSRDFMVSDLTLRPTNTSFGLKLGFQGMLVNGVMIKVNGDFYGGQVSGASIDFGAGYTVGRNKFHFRPALMFSYGSHGLSLGTLRQNGSYIQVNATEFWTENVTVRLKANHWVVSPQIELGYEVTEKFEILVSGGYNFGTTTKPFLKFSGYDYYDEWVTEKEPITIPNATLYHDGERLNKSPVKMNGVFIHAGLGFRFPN